MWLHYVWYRIKSYVPNEYGPYTYCSLDKGVAYTKGGGGYFLPAGQGVCGMCGMHFVVEGTHHRAQGPTASSETAAFVHGSTTQTALQSPYHSLNLGA